MVDFFELSRMYLYNHNERNFKEHFGLSSNMARIVWETLNERFELANGTRPKHLLWWLHWAKTYQTVGVCANFCKCSNNTWKEWVEYIEECLVDLAVVRT